MQKLIHVFTGNQLLTDDPISIDRDVKCDCVVISVRAVADDAADTIKAGAASFINDGRQEAYWGFDNVAVHPIYPGTTSDMIHVAANANEIFLRGNIQAPAAIRAFYTCYKYQGEK